MSIKAVALMLVFLDLAATASLWAYLKQIRADSPFLMAIAAVWVFAICFAMFLLAYTVSLRVGASGRGNGSGRSFAR